MMRVFYFCSTSTPSKMNKLLIGLLALAAGQAALAAQTTPVPDVSPSDQGWHVVINIPQQRLFLYSNGKLQKAYPVAVGKAHTQTVLGEHRIGAKAFNPTWHIPKSIQRERGDGVTSVPPGPSNPLGPVFVRLGEPKLGLGIHGTSNPSSVPGVRSHGCVRMKSPDALQFAKTITSGSPASVVYEMAALNVDDGGNLWLAAFSDPYRKNNLKTATLKQSIAAWAQSNGRNVSSAKVDQVLKARRGTPVCISCSGAAKIQGNLRSLAWHSGSAKLTAAKANMLARPTQDQVLPEGSSIEVDTGENEIPLKPQRSGGKHGSAYKATSVFDDEQPISVFEPGEKPLTPVNKP